MCVSGDGGSRDEDGIDCGDRDKYNVDDDCDDGVCGGRDGECVILADNSITLTTTL